MTDHITALADHMDRESECHCVDTLRGLDRAGCPRHDPEEPDEQEGPLCT